MRMIPRAMGPNDPPPSLVIPSVAPTSDFDSEILSQASDQRGVSNLMGAPVEIPMVRPTMRPEDVDVRLGYIPQVQQAPEIPMQPIQQPIQQVPAVHVPAFQVVNEEIFEPDRPVRSVDRNWSVICRGMVEEAKLDISGACVTVRSEDGNRYEAYVRDIPLIQIGILVELGVRTVTDGKTGVTTTVADIVPQQR